MRSRRVADRYYTWLVHAAFFGIVVSSSVRSLSGELWDDALFFQRIGYNLVHHGVAAWNVADGPVHGNTSQLFQLLAAAIVAIAPTHYQLTVRLCLGACLWLAFSLCAQIAAGDARGVGASPDRASSLALVFCAFCAPPLQLLIASGMETLLAIAVLSLSLLVVYRCTHEGFDSASSAVTAFTLSQLLVYLARPDLSLCAGLASLGLMHWRTRPLWRQRYSVMISCFAAGLVALLLLFHAYYGTALPLSFYVKNRLLSHYDADYLRLDREGNRRQLCTWLVLAAPFSYVALFRLRSWVGWLLAGAFALVGYHALLTVGIMAYHARFLLPALVPIAIAAKLAWPEFVATGSPWRRTLPVIAAWPALGIYAYTRGQIESQGANDPASWIDPRAYAAFGVPTLILLCSAALTGRARAAALISIPLVALALFVAPLPRLPEVLDDEHIEQRAALQWPGLSEVKRCLAEPMHIYHSELGLPGVLFLGSRITDLSGLMNPRIALGMAAFDEDCQRNPPEVLFLPHRDYRHFNESIAASSCLRLYARVESTAPFSSPLYVRRDKFREFKRCVAAAH